MREQRYGRVVFTASAAGIYGNFGQANYSAAKLAIVGLANTLAREGKERNVLANVIAPIAGTRLTAGVMPENLGAKLRPEHVSPLVAYLCHERSTETGALFEVGGGFIAKLRWERTQGLCLDPNRAIEPEDIAAGWDRVTRFDEATHPGDAVEAMRPVFENIGFKG